MYESHAFGFDPRLPKRKIVPMKGRNSRANDPAIDSLQHLYDVCLVWALEIPERGVVEGDFCQLGDRFL